MDLVDTRETAMFDTLRDSHGIYIRLGSPASRGAFEGQLQMYAAFVGRDAEAVRKDVYAIDSFMLREDPHGPGVSHTCRECGEHVACDARRPCYRAPSPAGSLCAADKSEVSE